MAKGKKKKSVKAKTITVGYWSIRGLGAPLRMMVMYSGAKLNAVNYDGAPKQLEGGKMGWDMERWFVQDKPKLKTENPLINLPYVRVNKGMVVTQTNACFAHVGRALKMFGSNKKEAVQCEQLLCEVMDIRNKIVDLSYGGGGNDKESASKVVANAKSSFGKIATWLAAKPKGTCTFLVGRKASAPDFHLYEMMDQFTALAAFHGIDTPFSAESVLLEWFVAFRALEQNQRYLTSVLAKLPVNNKMAQWGATRGGEEWTAETTYDWANDEGIF